MDKYVRPIIFNQSVRDHADFGRISSNMNLILNNNEIPYF